MKKPLVSIICITFNQEPFIAQTLDSFLMQKTDFPIEILIHDDVSTDKTTEIVRAYEKAHPGVIKPIYEKQNQYSTGDYSFVTDMFKAAKGKYIAFCEGDDYWTDPSKLQRQVDFLERHPSYAVCFHPVRVVFEKGQEKDSIYPNIEGEPKFTVQQLIEHNFIQSCSAMYRKQPYQRLRWDIMPQDWYFHLYHAQAGKIGCINQVMATYRRHGGGVWWGAHRKTAAFWERFGMAHLAMYDELLKLFGDKPAHKKAINRAVAWFFNEFIQTGEARDKLLKDALAQHPEITVAFLLYQYGLIQEQQAVLEDKDRELHRLHDAVRLKDDHIADLEGELNLVKNSRGWKLLEQARKVKPRAKTA